MRGPAESRPAEGPVASAVTWHDVECGAYAGDLRFWRELCEKAAGPVLELGCGTGRVALHLAAAGFEVTGLDHDPDLLGELTRRADAAGLAIDAVEADARGFRLEKRFALVIAPMQLVQLLGGPRGRQEMLASASLHLDGGGRAALTLVAEEAAVPDSAPARGSPPPLPDVREVDGWIYSSLPLEVRQVPGGLEVRRLRQLVAPGGELSEEVDATRLDTVMPEALDEEAQTAGLRVAGRDRIPPTADHVGSTVLLLEAG